MHRKVRKKKTSKLAACSSNSKKRTSHLRISKEKRRIKTKCRTSRVAVSTSAPDSTSTRSRQICHKKSQMRKKERGWQRNAIDPKTLPSPQSRIPPQRSFTAWDENTSGTCLFQPTCLDRPMSTSSLDGSQTCRVTPRRGRSGGPPDATGTPPLPSITRKCKNTSPIAILMERIKSIHVPGRPYPDTNNMEVLGHELKFRLSTRVPVIRGKVDKTGLFHFTESPADGRRHVTMYDITDDDDLHKSCDVRIPKPSPAALLLDSMLRENRTRHQAMELGNRNANNNKHQAMELGNRHANNNCIHQSAEEPESGVLNIDINSPSPVSGRLNCQVM